MTGDRSEIVTVTLSLDTSAYASGDLIADTQEIVNATGRPGATAILQSLVIHDEDDQGVALYVVVTSSSATAGTENSAPTITDANARSIQAIVPVATTDYLDVGGSKVACIKNIGALVKSAATDRSLYCFVVNSTGTPTYTATGVRLDFGFLQDV